MRRVLQGVWAALVMAGMLPPGSSRAVAGDPEALVISAQDGKYQRVAGRDTVRQPPAPDSLVVLDTAPVTPRVVLRLDRGVAQAIAGPPQSVAISADGRLALLGAANHLDTQGSTVPDPVLQVVRLDGPEAGLVARLPMGAVIQGVAFNHAGTLALACGVDGQVRVLRVANGQVSLLATLRVAPHRLASVVFTPDGRHALVTRRDDGGVAVLEVAGEQVRTTGLVLASGLAPYAIDVSADGHWAVVGDVGLAGLASFDPATDAADADAVTLYDLSGTPFRAVAYTAVPGTPEGVAISADGRWVAVQSMAGSFLPPGLPGHTAQGRVTLLANEAGHLVETSRLPDGVAAQGIAFGAGGRTVLVQQDTERAIAVFRRVGGRLEPGPAIGLAAGPVAMRTVPR